MSYESLLASVGDAARKGWTGMEGERRALAVMELIDKKVPAYAEAFGIDKEEMLALWEKQRSVSVPNYYQQGNIPDLGSVRLFDTRDAFRAAVPSGKFRCPACNGESTDPQECNSGVKTDGETCNWKSYGFFGTMGKGVSILIKEWKEDRTIPLEIFMPVDFEEAKP